MMHGVARAKNRTGAYVIHGLVRREGPLTLFIE
jgi:hypothetical protein